MKEFRTYSLAFYGRGEEYFKIRIVNTILNILTLSLYYPWAKERSLKYLYNKNTFEETPFVFSGTGKEMFKGYIKALAIFVLLYGAFFYFWLILLLLLCVPNASVNLPANPKVTCLHHLILLSTDSDVFQ